MREEEKYFRTYYGIKKPVTDKKFLEILKICWEERMDMNFDDWPDFEDLMWIREQDFKYYILNKLAETHYEQKLGSKIRSLFGE